MLKWRDIQKGLRQTLESTHRKRIPQLPTIQNTLPSKKEPNSSQKKGKTDKQTNIIIRHILQSQLHPRPRHYRSLRKILKPYNDQLQEKGTVPNPCHSLSKTNNLANTLVRAKLKQCPDQPTPITILKSQSSTHQPCPLYMPQQQPKLRNITRPWWVHIARKITTDKINSAVINQQSEQTMCYTQDIRRTHSNLRLCTHSNLRLYTLIFCAKCIDFFFTFTAI